MSFSELGLKDSLCHAVARLGYAEPTPVQAAAIPVVLGLRSRIRNRRDVGTRDFPGAMGSLKSRR